MEIEKQEGIEIKNNLINCKNNSKLNLIIKKNKSIKINIEENSITNIQILNYGNFNLNLILNKNSVCNFGHINFGNSKNNCNIEIKKNAKLNCGHISLCKNNEQSYSIINNILNEKSNVEIISRDIVENKSLIDLKCLIKINKNGNNALGNQDLKTLMLNKNCVSKTAPLLEIENKNVKCRHASGTIYPNKNELFYLISRGINENEALNIIKKSHINKVLNLFNEENKKIIIDAI